ncbi:hypothetical protein FHW69_001517 [Luteibacter sp. Sphag1AF]|uniref:DUF4279 domain-containing protein n=1 Tax=Luteibacter sp. Sphag1AF TaxID=2587031 RepID=UPI0016152F3B|nr:DUF4279 domain-containing protein [Luteibacter sp. Sphag1AF]MBB3226916.1 hypothetical protein [Luteibacter sp. Sphag1AF]
MTDAFVCVRMYLEGKDLNPDIVTCASGLEPSTVARIGEPVTWWYDVPPLHATNSWSRLVREASADVSTTARKVTDAMHLLKEPLTTLRGFGSGRFDVMVVEGVGKYETLNPVEFVLDSDVIGRVCETGLPLRISVGNVVVDPD